MRDGLALGLLIAGIWLVLSVQLALAPYSYMHDQVSGQVTRVYCPDNRPVLVLCADVLDCAQCELAAWLAGN
jgi:hypothetical protein